METPAIAAETPEQSAEEPVPAIEDLAARDYNILLAKYHKLSDSVYFSQLRRVFNAVVEYPFADSNPKFNSKVERELFFVVSSIMDCKFVMMKTFLSMKQDEINKFLNEESKGESNVETSVD